MNEPTKIVIQRAAIEIFNLLGSQRTGVVTAAAIETVLVEAFKSGPEVPVVNVKPRATQRTPQATAKKSGKTGKPSDSVPKPRKPRGLPGPPKSSPNLSQLPLRPLIEGNRRCTRCDNNFTPKKDKMRYCDNCWIAPKAFRAQRRTGTVPKTARRSRKETSSVQGVSSLLQILAQAVSQRPPGKGARRRNRSGTRRPKKDRKSTGVPTPSKCTKLIGTGDNRRACGKTACRHTRSQISAKNDESGDTHLSGSVCFCSDHCKICVDNKKGSESVKTTNGSLPAKQTTAKEVTNDDSWDAGSIPDEPEFFDDGPDTPPSESPPRAVTTGHPLTPPQRVFAQRTHSPTGVDPFGPQRPATSQPFGAARTVKRNCNRCSRLTCGVDSHSGQYCSDHCNGCIRAKQRRYDEDRGFGRKSQQWD